MATKLIDKDEEAAWKCLYYANKEGAIKMKDLPEVFYSFFNDGSKFNKGFKKYPIGEDIYIELSRYDVPET